MSRNKKYTRPVVYELLNVGKENAIPCRVLRDRNNLKSDRSIVKEVEKLVNEGYVICSDVGGYYRPANPEELEEHIRIRKKHEKSNTARTAMLIKALKAMRSKD